VASLNLLTQYADTIILAAFRTTDVVGYYTAAMTIARLFLVSNSALMYLYLPVASRLRSTGNMGAVRRSYVTSARWTVATTLPLFFVCFFDPKQTIGFAFGPRYLEAAHALEILAVGSMISVVIGPSPAAIAGLGHARSNMTYGMASLATNITLSLALIPSMGLVGAAIAWAIARVIYPGLCVIHLAVVYQVHPFEGSFLRPTALSLVVLTPLFFLLPPIGSVFLLVPALFLLAFAVTLATFPLTRSIEPGDLAILGAVESATRTRFPRLRAYLSARMPPGRVPN
jgi:O-antigen/teichoic acid export membrane protein